MTELNEITTLEELLEFLQNENTTDIDMSDLPTFGGSTPNTTECVWSWDNEKILIGECSDDFQIVDRNFITDFNLDEYYTHGNGDKVFVYFKGEPIFQVDSTDIGFEKIKTHFLERNPRYKNNQFFDDMAYNSFYGL